jgi:hypothetical protein
MLGQEDHTMRKHSSFIMSTSERPDGRERYDSIINQPHIPENKEIASPGISPDLMAQSLAYNP